MVSWKTPGSISEAPGIDFGFPRLDSVAVVTNFSNFSCEQTLQEPLSITMARPKKMRPNENFWPNCSFYANPCVQKFETSCSLFPQRVSVLETEFWPNLLTCPMPCPVCVRTRNFSRSWNQHRLNTTASMLVIPSHPLYTQDLRSGDPRFVAIIEQFLI